MKNYRLSVSYATIGTEEAKNQDNMLIDRFIGCCSGLEEFSGHIKLCADEKRIFAVSDGAGGEADGDRASDITVHTAGTHIEHIKWSDTESALRSTLDEINNDVVRFFKQTGSGGAATLSGVVFEKDTVWVFNAGDSPVFHIRKRRMKRLSEEHTLAREKYGDKAVGKSSRDANTITRYMGNAAASGSEQMHLANYPVEEKDIFVIASDGVEKGLSERKIRRLAAKEREDCARLLVEKARRGGSTDDITAIVIRIEPTDSKGESK